MTTNTHEARAAQDHCKLLGKNQHPSGEAFNTWSFPGFYAYKSDGRLWFRVFGRGLSFVRKDKWLFSMRNGIGCLRAFDWAVEYLKPY